MRVVSGSARGLKLRAPDGLDTRPTADRIKESLFNIISNDLYNIDFLDIYSGSGAIGIEALSRGAKKAVFIDLSEKSREIIEYNLKKAHFSEKAEIIKKDALLAVFGLGKEKRKFDVIFMDPPYKKGLVEKTLKAVLNLEILKKDGFIIAEQSSEEPLISVDGFKVMRIKKYNKIKLTFIGYDYSED